MATGEAGHINMGSRCRRTPSDVTIAGQQHDVLFPTAASQQLALRTIADWGDPAAIAESHRRRGKFSIQGGDRKQYQVLIDPTALLEYGVTFARGRTSLEGKQHQTSGGFAVQGETERRSVCWPVGAGFASGCGRPAKIPIKVHPDDRCC